MGRRGVRCYLLCMIDIRAIAPDLPVQDVLPAVLALWQGEYEPKGVFWQFPTSTSVPKPLQQPQLAWCPGGRTTANAFASSPRSTRIVASSTQPVATLAASAVPSLQ